MKTLAKVSNGHRLPGVSNWIEDWFGRELPSFSTEFLPSINKPATNIRELPDSYELEVLAPGWKKSDFEVNVDNGLLTISAEAKKEEEMSEDNYTRREFGYSSFKRTFTLPDTIDSDKVDARYEDGILYVILPKVEHARQKPVRRIDIK